MRAIVLGLGALLFQEPPEDPKKKEARIAQLIEWLSDPDPDVRAMGEKDLPSFGKDAIPAIQKKLQEKGVGPLVKVLRDLERKAETWVDEKEIKGEGEDPRRSSSSSPARRPPKRSAASSGTATR
jgi:hypothetical protein